MEHLSEKSRGYQSGRRTLEKTMRDFARALEQTLFADEIARKPGLFQSLDPRAKLVGILSLLLAVSLARSLLVIAAIYLLTLPLAAASAIPLGFYLKRVWVFMPFFTGLVALPAIFSGFTPGDAAVVLLNLPASHVYLAITWPGLVTAAFLLLRVGASVSLAVLLILTTRWTALLKALRVLQVPQAFVVIMGMTYRYIYVLLHSANSMFEARRSRKVGRLSSGEERRWLATATGTLMAKSYALSDDVYLAMRSRGFRGEVQTIDTFQWQPRDWAALAGFLAAAALAVWLGR